MGLQGVGGNPSAAAAPGSDRAQMDYKFSIVHQLANGRAEQMGYAGVELRSDRSVPSGKPDASFDGTLPKSVVLIKKDGSAYDLGMVIPLRAPTARHGGGKFKDGPELDKEITALLENFHTADSKGASSAFLQLTPPTRVEVAKGDVVEAGSTTPRERVQVEQAKTADTQRANASVQARRQDSLFSVQEPVAERAEVKALLTGSKVSGAQLEKLFAAGISPSDLDRDLVKNGDGPLAPLLTGHAMNVLLEKLPAGEHPFLEKGGSILPKNMSIKQAEAKLAEREKVQSKDPRVQELVAKGMTPQEALRTVASQLDIAPAKKNELPPPPQSSPPPVAPSLAAPEAANPELQALLKNPALAAAINATTGRAVNAQDMQAMIQAVGPQGLKQLGSAVVFGSGGLSSRMMPEAINTFMQAVHEQTGGATAGGVPAQAYGGQSPYRGPAANASTLQGFVQDPGLQYLGNTYGNAWDPYAGSTAMWMNGGNLMNYGNQFMYGGGYYPSYGAYTGQGAYNGGLIAGNGYYQQPQPQRVVVEEKKPSFGEKVGKVLGAVVGGIGAGALTMGAMGMMGMGMGWGLGYGGYYSPASMWGLGMGTWGMYPGNMMGYNMMYGGWPYAMSMW